MLLLSLSLRPCVQTKVEAYALKLRLMGERAAFGPSGEGEGGRAAVRRGRRRVGAKACPVPVAEQLSVGA